MYIKQLTGKTSVNLFEPRFQLKPDEIIDLVLQKITPERLTRPHPPLTAFVGEQKKTLIKYFHLTVLCYKNSSYVEVGIIFITQNFLYIKKLTIYLNNAHTHKCQHAHV